MRRQQQLHERALQGDQGAQAAMMRQQQFAGLNRAAPRQFRDRREDFLTSQELELAMEAHVKSGKMRALGVAHVPEDRLRQGLVPAFLAYYRDELQTAARVKWARRQRG